MTDNKLTTTTPGHLAQLGQAANQAAAAHTFADYHRRKARHTRRRQQADLALFAEFLANAGGEPGNLFEDPESWQGITWGLVKAFVEWQLSEGYAIGSINVRLSTVKTYAKLAARAGMIDPAALALIRTVEGYRAAEGKRVDEARAAADLPTRTGHKKATATPLTPDQAQRLKSAHTDDPQGRRDRLLMCLLLDHGLRAGEVAGLKVNHILLNEKPPMMQFIRPKVDKEQRHRLTPDTLESVRAYLASDAPALGPLLRASRKGGELVSDGMTVQAITGRVRYLGQQLLGLEGLSAHDCRHYWATQAARSGTPIDRLMDAGGWNSHAMPLRYVEAAEIANEGVKLS